MESVRHELDELRQSMRNELIVPFMNVLLQAEEQSKQKTQELCQFATRFLSLAEMAMKLIEGKNTTNLTTT